MKTVQQLQEELHRFGLIDYGVFVAMLIGCSAVGVWYAWSSSKKSSAEAEEEYMMGGRNMAVFPVAMSLVATFISGITLLGHPTEMYLYGTEFYTAILCVIPKALIFSYFYLPVFHQLKMTSVYEYLERRFSRKVRMLGSILFGVLMMTWLPIVIYVPALAFNQVTGINVHIITPVVCTVCVFYTCLGGLKAVVWTDVIQTCIMIGSIFLTVLKGTWDVGGLPTVMERSRDGQRLVFPSTDWDFTTRHTIQGLTMGALVSWMNSLLGQDLLQRFLALPTLRKARCALAIYTFGLMVIMTLVAYTGLLAYSMYHTCDPLTTKLAANRDQIVPLMVMEILGIYPGLPGLFVAGVFSASLSSLSTGLNSIASVVLEDFVRTTVKRDLSSRTNLLILRVVTVIFGVICVLLVVIVEHLGTVLQGAFYGGITGLLSTSVVILGAQNAIVDGKLKFVTKPVTVEGCDYLFNSTIAAVPNMLPADSSDVFPLYKISYMWYTPLGALITISVALLVSSATGGLSAYVDPLLVSPPLRKWVATRKRKEFGTTEMINLEKEKEKLNSPYLAS